MLADDLETFPESVPAVKSSHLALDFHHLQRRGDSFAEKARKAAAQKALRSRQSVIRPHRAHPCLAQTLICETPLIYEIFEGQQVS